MRKVIFEKVGMKNFGPYITPLEYKIKDGVLTLITGPNGIGKTMSLDAFSYTLYGITSKGARGDDVVNNIIGKNCHTWVDFKINDDKYSVNRYYKHSKFRNTVLLSKNGHDPYKKGQKEVLPEIERLILPRQLFMNTIMFAQKVKDFFTDLGDADKKEIFRKVLRLEEYVLFYNNAKNKLDEIITDIDKAKNTISVHLTLKKDAESQVEHQKLLEIEYNKNKHTQLTEYNNKKQTNNMILNKLVETVNKLKENDTDLETILTEIATLTAELNNIDSVLEGKKQKINSDALQKESEIKDKANEFKTKIINDFKKMIDLYQQEKKEKEKKLAEQHLLLLDDRSKIREEFLTLKNKENVLQESIIKIKESILSAKVSICPTCKQEITKETRERLLLKNESAVKEIAIIKSKLKENFEKGNKIANQIEDSLKQSTEVSKLFDLKIQQCTIDEQKKLEENDNKLNISLGKIQEIITRLEEEIEKEFADKTVNLGIKLNKLKSDKEAIEIIIKDISNQEKMINNLQNDIIQIDRDIERIQNSKFDKTTLNSAMKRIIDLKQQLHLANDSILELEKLHKVISFWKEGFSSRGIPSMLIDDSVPFMNERVTYYLEKISNGRYIVSFDTLDETKSGEFRDKISVKVVDTETKANKRVQLSGGQTRLIDIATILTLGDLQSKVQEVTFNILLFDEIFDSLDDTNVEFVSKVLRILTDDRSVFVISHKHVDQLEADDVYNFS